MSKGGPDVSFVDNKWYVGSDGSLYIVPKRDKHSKCMGLIGKVGYSNKFDPGDQEDAFPVLKVYLVKTPDRCLLLRASNVIFNPRTKEPMLDWGDPEQDMSVAAMSSTRTRTRTPKFQDTNY